MKRFAAAVLVVALLGVAATVAWQRARDEVRELLPDECTARVDGLSSTLDPEQARNAALIVAIAVRRGLPARAATIALATVFQESRLYNLDYGDRDSLGLFQQRPSQGWGTRAQVTDPVYAANRFYDALVRVPGYESMEITVAAQTVQRSAYPKAYAQHEPEARALASALTGHSPRGFSCRLNLPEPGRATTVRRELTGVFGSLLGTPVIRGRTVAASVADRRTGWAAAHYLVAQAPRLGIRRVAFAGHEWTAGAASADGWTTDAAPLDGHVVVDLVGSEVSLGQ